MDQSNMSSVRKKLDEYHLKVLRELVTLPANKYCFDCHQRGPTYVNVTIGSFVCTKCSGMLRGLTPPHRVKSISMATFTPEEMEFIKSRGNDYCRKVWLGLHGADQPTKDELQIKDFMISKYEKKRYYVDPAIVPTINGNNTNSNGSSSKSTPPNNLPQVISGANMGPMPIPPNTLQLRTTKITSSPVANHSFTPKSSSNFYAANFGSPTASPDPFSSPVNTTLSSTTSSEASFANFDQNPIFSVAAQGVAKPVKRLPIFNLTMGKVHDPGNANTMDIPHVKINEKHVSEVRKAPQAFKSSPNINIFGQTNIKAPNPTPPTEDKYAALKDLDCLMKTQQTTSATPEAQPAAPIGEWGSNGNISWGTSSIFDTPSTLPKSTSAVPSNPFNNQNGSVWSPFNSSCNNSFSGNPFRVPLSESAWSIAPNGQIPNGLPTSQSLNFASTKAWIKTESPIHSNPFSLSPSSKDVGHHSSNPFLQ